jgi:hypothetical protein
MHTTVRYLLALAALIGSMTPLPAQDATPLGAVRVTLVAGTPSRAGRTEVVRRAQRTPRNLVLVDRNATAEDLAAALVMINALRVQYGDTLTTDFRARPETVRPGRNWNRSAYRSWLVQQLVRLRAATPGNVADLGVVRTVQITLPAPTGVVTTPGGRRG